MTEMTLEQVRDQLCEWGKVDHSPLCVNCGYWADAIDDALQSRAQGEAVAWMHNTNGDAFVISDTVKKIWLNVHPQHVEHYTIPLYKSLPAAAVTDEMVECASEAYNDVYTAEITANTSADNKHQAIRAALEAALGSP